MVSLCTCSALSPGTVIVDFVLSSVFVFVNSEGKSVSSYRGDSTVPQFTKKTIDVNSISRTLYRAISCFTFRIPAF